MAPSFINNNNNNTYHLMVTTGTVLGAFCRSFYETQKACEVSVISIPISEIWRLKHKASSFVLSDLGGRGEV